MEGALSLDVRGYLGRRLEDRTAARGYALIVLVVGVALAFYFVGAQGIPQRGTWFVVGEVLGITAGVLLPLTAILAVRASLLEWLFGDMTKVYVAHGIVGLTMFGLVTVHPLLYFFGLLPATNTAAGVLVPFNVVVLDWISWIAIALALLPTLFVRMRFDLWRYTHIFLGAAVVVTAISLTVDSNTFDTIKIPALRIYLFILFGLAIAAILHVTLLRRIVAPKHEYRVTAAEPHPEANAIELMLEPVGKPLRHHAGQFTYVELLDDRVQAKREFAGHPYSICCPPAEDGRLSIIVEAIGNTTRRAQEIASGDGAHALVRGSYGRLPFHPDGPPKRLWMGGGIGVTPFLAMAEELVEDPAGRDVVLVIGVDHAGKAFYRDRLRALEARSGGTLRVLLWERDKRGLPTAEGLQEEVPDLAERVAVMAGPDPMIAALTPELKRVGVRHIHSEVAIGPPRAWRYGGTRALRLMRWLIAAEMAVFVGAAVVSTVGRAV
jgi:predicted ferric reductase